MSSLNHYKSLAEEHWKQFLPERWKELKANGELNEAIENAAKLTDSEMQAAIEAGMPRDQAWEEIRGRYLMPEPEPESEEDEPSPNRPGLRLIHDVIDATQEIYDNL